MHVSLAESLDAFHALPLVPWSDPAVFRTALAATLIKRRRDRPAFDRLFPLHFGLGGSAAGTLAGGVGGPVGSAEAMAAQALEDEWQRFDEQHQAGAMAGFLVLGGGGRTSAGLQVGALLRQAAQEAGLPELSYAAQASLFVRRILERLGWQEARQMVALFLQEMEEAGLPPRDAARARERVEANARAAAAGRSGDGAGSGGAAGRGPGGAGSTRNGCWRRRSPR